MQTVTIVILNALCAFVLGIFLKNYLPNYMEQKGKNLATKEDIKEITQKSESVLQDFRKEFLDFSSDKTFKYDFYFDQYSKLYTELYASVCQSEYLRYFLQLHNQTVAFDDAPFVEISPTTRRNMSITINTGEPVQVKHSEEQFETDISKFNKKQICDLIISNGQYASQKLLKLAVCYRFAQDFYSGNTNAGDTDVQNNANSEELRLIKEIVLCIVKEYNLFRKELKIEYDEGELVDGLLHTLSTN